MTLILIVMLSAIWHHLYYLKTWQTIVRRVPEITSCFIKNRDNKINQIGSKDSEENFPDLRFNSIFVQSNLYFFVSLCLAVSLSVCLCRVFISKDL